VPLILFEINGSFFVFFILILVEKAVLCKLIKTARKIIAIHYRLKLAPKQKRKLSTRNQVLKTIRIS